MGCCLYFKEGNLCRDEKNRQAFTLGKVRHFHLQEPAQGVRLLQDPTIIPFEALHSEKCGE